MATHEFNIHDGDDFAFGSDNGKRVVKVRVEQTAAGNYVVHVTPYPGNSAVGVITH